MLNSESGQASCVSKRVSQPSLAATGSTGNDDVLVESNVIIGSQSVEQRSIDLAICIPINSCNARIAITVIGLLQPSFESFFVASFAFAAQQLREILGVRQICRRDILFKFHGVSDHGGQAQAFCDGKERTKRTGHS